MSTLGTVYVMILLRSKERERPGEICQQVQGNANTSSTRYYVAFLVMESPGVFCDLVQSHFSGGLLISDTFIAADSRAPEGYTNGYSISGTS